MWRRAMRNVAPLAKGGSPDLSARHGGDKSASPAPSSGRAPQPGIAASRPTATRAADPFSSGDPRLDRRAGRGRIPIEGTLDLHGLTQAAARQTLLTFLTSARAAGKRCVLVITGKGAPYPAASSPARGVLRTRLRDWLREDAFRIHVARASQAHRRHGGAGAFYLFLKSPRARYRGEK